jgi:hypothetical protein
MEAGYEGTVKTLTIVNNELNRPAAGTEAYTIVEYFDGAALLESGNQTDSYYVADPVAKNIFESVYEPNKDVADGENKAIGLFHVVLGVAEDGSEDIIEVKGDNVPSGDGLNGTIEIQIGAPGADNSALPDFIIPPGALGNGGPYSGTRIVVNSGAYLNIDSDQAIGSLASQTPGQFVGGNITVKSGGKLRDGAYSDWPLGSNSTFSIEAGGYLAVGPGNKDGNYEQRHVEELIVGDDPYERGFDGWLIGPEGDASSRIQLGKTDYASSQIWVAQDWAYLVSGSYAKVAQYANVYPYNILVGSGSIVEIAAELDTKQGDTQARFYGVPATASSPTPEPASFVMGTVKITGDGKVSGAALGLDSEVGIVETGTYYCSPDGIDAPTASDAPWASAKSFVCSWSIEETPVDEEPADEEPVDDEPSDEEPIEETPIEETPAEQPAT